MHPGATFGEVALLSGAKRIASVVATEPSRCLVLSKTQVHSAAAKIPDVAVKVLLNLSLILCDRLRDVTSSALRDRMTPDAA